MLDKYCLDGTEAELRCLINSPTMKIIPKLHVIVDQIASPDCKLRDLSGSVRGRLSPSLLKDFPSVANGTCLVLENAPQLVYKKDRLVFLNNRCVMSVHYWDSSANKVSSMMCRGQTEVFQARIAPIRVPPAVVDLVDDDDGPSQGQ